jgi:hypothetical protein
MWKVICGLPEPWSERDTGRTPYEPRTVVFACIVKVFLNLTYEGVETGVKTADCSPNSPAINA